MGEKLQTSPLLVRQLVRTPGQHLAWFRWFAFGACLPVPGVDPGRNVKPSQPGGLEFASTSFSASVAGSSSIRKAHLDFWQTSASSPPANMTVM